GAALATPPAPPLSRRTATLSHETNRQESRAASLLSPPGAPTIAPNLLPNCPMGSATPHCEMPPPSPNAHPPPAASPGSPNKSRGLAKARAAPPQKKPASNRQYPSRLSQ